MRCWEGCLGGVRRCPGATLAVLTGGSLVSRGPVRGVRRGQGRAPSQRWEASVRALVVSAGRCAGWRTGDPEPLQRQRSCNIRPCKVRHSLKRVVAPWREGRGPKLELAQGWVPAQLVIGLPLPLTCSDRRLGGKVRTVPRVPTPPGGCATARLNVWPKTCWWR